jgi:hypothetical protein
MQKIRKEYYLNANFSKLNKLGVYAGYEMEKLFSSKVNPALLRMMFAKTGNVTRGTSILLI